MPPSVYSNLRGKNKYTIDEDKTIRKIFPALGCHGACKAHGYLILFLP